MASWDDAEQQYKDNRNANSKFFKLEDDGEQAAIIFLGAPEPTENENPRNGDKWTSYVIDIYNLDTGKKQEWSMGVTAFKAAVGLKRAIGADAVAGSVISVVRNGAKGDTKTSYTMIPLGPVDQQLADELGIVPAQPKQAVRGGNRTQAPAAQVQRVAAPVVQDRGFLDVTAIQQAKTIEALNAAVGLSWEAAGGDPEDEAAIQEAAGKRKAELSVVADPIVKRRPPTF